MKTGRFFYLSMLLTLMIYGFVGCSDDDDEVVVPIQTVTSVTFTDTDDTEGEIGGTLSWTHPSSISNITKYVIYNSSNTTSRESKLGETLSSISTYTVADGTEFLGYLIVVCANLAGESLSVAYVEVTDVIEDEEPVIDPATLGVFFLNGGINQENNSTLDFYNIENELLIQRVFSSVNGRALGDTAYDMVVYGSKAYIALTNSNTIEIINLSGESLKTIRPLDAEGNPQYPRNLTTYNGDVYVTLLDGHLACIDTLGLDIAARAITGPNPEGVTAANGKLYIANSGDSQHPDPQDNTITIIDATTFVNDDKSFEAALNPKWIDADSEGVLYIVSDGNIGEEKASLQRLDPITGQSTIIDSNDILHAALCNDKLYYLSAESNDGTLWNTRNVKYKIYDTKTESLVTNNFITDGTTLENVFSINVDPVNETIYIGTSDTINTGDMYLFSPEGQMIKQFELSGLNPVGAYFYTVGVE